MFKHHVNIFCTGLLGNNGRNSQMHIVQVLYESLLTASVKTFLLLSFSSTLQTFSNNLKRVLFALLCDLYNVCSAKFAKLLIQEYSEMVEQVFEISSKRFWSRLFLVYGLPQQMT